MPFYVPAPLGGKLTLLTGFVTRPCNERALSPESHDLLQGRNIEFEVGLSLEVLHKLDVVVGAPHVHRRPRPTLPR